MRVDACPLARDDPQLKQLALAMKLRKKLAKAIAALSEVCATPLLILIILSCVASPMRLLALVHSSSSCPPLPAHLRAQPADLFVIGVAAGRWPRRLLPPNGWPHAGLHRPRRRDRIGRV